ncbi:Ca2+-ATPase amino-terminal autoinhibitory domain protein [Medicago truncatula]|uniref:Ca2+-ATPase amino-terminal autoinhibitory domain protein n=1 Tax=Medicago truncatula TaxID=3880 RepID=A0A072TPC8_MEDTR|nr:Ca2+-ATPase amino-terminal autoinhibitory domain protein [Medicago truncatula]
MEGFLKDFELEDKDRSIDALSRWRSAVSLVKNPRRRFRNAADLGKRVLLNSGPPNFPKIAILTPKKKTTKPPLSFAPVTVFAPRSILTRLEMSMDIHGYREYDTVPIPLDKYDTRVRLVPSWVPTKWIPAGY